MTQGFGALSGSREPDPQAVPALSGFDPAREFSLSIVPRPLTPCWPWHLREVDDRHPIGAQCAECARDVALDPLLKSFEAVCLYCALDSDLLPAVEIEPGED